MKKSILALLLWAAAASTTNANNNIPVAVQESFAQLYPEAEAPFWEKRHDGIVAIFRDGEGLKKAFFQEDGQWQETRIRMEREKLPEGVNNFIRENYREADISFCGKVYTESGAWYRIESELPDQIVLKTLDDEGTLIEERAIPLSVDIQPASALKATPAKLLPRQQIRLLDIK